MAVRIVHVVPRLYQGVAKLRLRQGCKKGGPTLHKGCAAAVAR